MTYLIQAPPYLFAYIFVLAMSWSVGRHMEHCWHIIATSVFGIIGVVIVVATLNPGARYFGMFLMVAGPFAGVTYVSTLYLRDILLTIVQNPRSLGDNERASTPNETRRTHRHHELCCYCLTLVQPLLLCESHANNSTYSNILTTAAPLSRTALSERRRSAHCWCWSGHRRLFGNEMVRGEKE